MRFVSVLNFLWRHATVGLSIAFVLLLGLIWYKPQWFFQPALQVTLQQADTPDLASLGSGPVSYAKAVSLAAPAVVNIYTAKLVTQRIPLFDDPLAQQLFGNPGIPRQRLERSLGSGVIVSAQGYVLTNNHVIEGAAGILVALHDGRTVEARLVGADPDTDLAVLKVALDNLPAITLGNSDTLNVGDVVLAIGNPFGVGQTVTHGIVSATGRTDLGINTFENFIQTDAPINPGNSGGALVNALGQLVGVNTAIFSRSGGSQGIGFAIPTTLAKQVLEQILEHGQVIRGWLGVETQDVTRSLANSLGLAEARGALVSALLRHGPAGRAGVQPGDVIIAINGQAMRDSRTAMTAISAIPPGRSVTLTVVRAGKQQEIQAQVEQRPRQVATQ